MPSRVNLLHAPNFFRRPIHRSDVGGAAIRLAAFSRWEGFGQSGQGGNGEEDSHDHLLAAEQRVADELARAQRNRGVRVGHLGGLMACRGWR
jgi:hypothetical protein